MMVRSANSGATIPHKALSPSYASFDTVWTVLGFCEVAYTSRKGIERSLLMNVRRGCAVFFCHVGLRVRQNER